jgi:membrane-bound serine protease (ClpP class)
MEPGTLALAYVLIGVGFLLLAAELFIPSGGVIFVLAIVSICGGVAMAFVYDASTGALTLIGVFIALPILGSLLLHYWPKTRMGKRFFLGAPQEEETQASNPLSQELEQMRGRLGRAISALRPSGVVDFDGQRVDVITEGMMVEPDEWVRCINVKAGKVVVRPVEKPNLGDLETAEF